MKMTPFRRHQNMLMPMAFNRALLPRSPSFPSGSMTCLACVPTPPPGRSNPIPIAFNLRSSSLMTMLELMADDDAHDIPAIMCTFEASDCDATD